MLLGSGYVHFFIENPEILSLFSMISNEQNLFLSLFVGMSEEKRVQGMVILLVTQKNFIPADQLDTTIDRVIRTPFWREANVNKDNSEF